MCFLFYILFSMFSVFPMVSLPGPSPGAEIGAEVDDAGRHVDHVARWTGTLFLGLICMDWNRARHKKFLSG